MDGAGDDEGSLDRRVSDSDRVTLTRDRWLSNRLVSEVYPHARSEQEAIRWAMADAVRWHDRGVRPDQLVATLRELVDGGSVEIAGSEFIVTVEKSHEK